MIAVIETGGKQYVVAEGDVIQVEKLDAAEGKSVTFAALMVGDDQSVTLGTPNVAAKVTGKVMAQGRFEKVTGVKHKAKKRELTRYGHRQAFTSVEITKIGA